MREYGEIEVGGKVIFSNTHYLCTDRTIIIYGDTKGYLLLITIYLRFDLVCILSVNSLAILDYNIIFK